MSDKKCIGSLVNGIMSLIMCRSCHRSSVIVQRAIEGSGIPTIIISALPDISIRCGAPRGVSPIVPIGANAGAPHHPLQQRKILCEALNNL